MSGNVDRERPEPAGADGLAELWRRVREHKIVQWTIAYVAIAYGIQHGITLTSEAFDWPHAVTRISMLLLMLALPIAITLAWYHGARASRWFSAGESTIISLLLVCTSMLFYVLVQPAGTAVPAARQLGVAAARNAAADPHGAISVAVLPFLNLSSDKEQEFFSDGMTEEVTSALAKIPNLRVVARTSAFQFKGQNRDIPAVAQALHATHLIEGSVRKDGNQVRITAQLIRGDDSSHLWTESYDRELKGIFAVQEDIAQSIAAALRVPLGLKPGESLVSNRNIDPDAYQQYLLARSLVRARALDQALMILEPLTAQYPDYAPASALLADAKYLLPIYLSPWLRTSPIEEARRNAEASLSSGAIAARRAIASDPRNASAYAALASIELVQEKWTDSDDLFRQALALDPNDGEILQAYNNFLEAVGRLKAWSDVVQHQHALEPFVPIYATSFAGWMLVNGQTAASIPILQAIPDSAVGFFRNVLLAYAYATLGRFNDAADTLLLTTGNQLTRQSLENAARVLRQAPNAGRPETLPQFTSELNFVYAFVGAPERAFEFPERLAEIGYIAPIAHWQLLLQRSSAPLRHMQRFKDYMRRIGLVDYWRARGWPDLCHPTIGDDFACN